MNSEESTLLEIAVKMLNIHVLCDRCLGRQFAWLGTGTSNKDRGHSIKLTLTMMADGNLRSGNKEQGMRDIRLLAENGMFTPAKEIATKNAIEFETRSTCYLCAAPGLDSFFDRIPHIAERIVELSHDIEFDTFLVGSVPPPTLVEHQDELNAMYSLLHSETLKSHFNRELGIHLHSLLGKEVDFDKPDIVYVYAMDKDELKLQVNPLFIFGRYCKLERGIPQSRWDCKKCKGKGCPECEGTGRRYQDSISEYVGIPSQQLVNGTRFKFHAAGREDVDVLMLGDGRPFVVEISEPRVRHLDLEELARKINDYARGKIEVHDLKMTDRQHLQKLKYDASSNVKEYKALIRTESIVEDELLTRAQKELTGIEIEQRTPNRVSHRRSDLVRKKQIHEIIFKGYKEELLEAFFKVQGGTYIKELISGDEGRTKPSVAEKLGTPCVCTELNVTAIYSEDSQ
ncbi:MAG: tRNA pseudouridine(54/55) synthase Pus10 [Candidatus Thorarchaeota archaeon]|nr:tRNA pseudouridine(54/55) synthase Pus10 [Candidatus Thorarchaeota archaeon]